MQTTRREKAKKYSQRARDAGAEAERWARKAWGIADDVVSEAQKARTADEEGVKADVDVVLAAKVSLWETGGRADVQSGGKR